MAMIAPLQFENWQWLALQLATPVVLWARLAVPPGRLAEPAPRRGDDGHPDLASGRSPRSAGRSYALFFGDAGMTGMTMPFELVTERGAGSDQIYLEVAAVVTTFILAGRYFEERAKRRAGAALRALLELGAKDVARARRRRRRAPRAGRRARGRRPLRRAAGREDRHRRRRSRAAPRRSTSRCSPASRVPVEVGPGDEVVGATVNVGGRLVVRATRVGEDTALAQIARLVDRGAVGQGARAAPRRPRLRRVRPGRDRRSRSPRSPAGSPTGRARPSPSRPRSRC